MIKNIKKVISGGALGADSVWSYLLEKHGMERKSIYHVIGFGLKRPTGGLDDNRIREQSTGTTYQLSADQMILGVEQLLALDVPISGLTAKEYFSNYNGNVTTLNSTQRLQIRNYFQVYKADNVYAVCEMRNGHPTGGTANAISTAIKLEKPVYVLDPLQGAWYKFVQGTWEKTSNVHLSGVCACIGTRALVKYKQCKYGKWVDAPYIGAANEKKVRAMMEAAIC